MAGFYGADVDQLRALGHDLTRQGAELEAIVARLTPKIQNVSWKGPDAQRFIDDWRSRLSASLRKVAEELQHAGQTATQNANAQAEASNGGAATADLGSISTWDV